MSEEKVAEVVEKLEFLERSGIAPHVAEGGQFTAVVIGTSQFDALGIPEPEEPVDFGKVQRVVGELRRMHHVEDERKALIEGFRRFKEGG